MTLQTNLIIFTLGLFSSLIFRGTDHPIAAKSVIALFITGSALNLGVLVSMAFLATPWVREFSSLAAHKFFIFLLGGFLLGYMLQAIKGWKSSPQNERTMVRLASLIMATYFVFTGVGKYIFWDAQIGFFRYSGYSASFLIFISLVEIGGAILLLFPTTARYAAVLLCIDMVGATYTHYHNFFTLGAADPFGNSVDSIKMHPFLFFIFLFGAQKSKPVAPYQ